MLSPLGGGDLGLDQISIALRNTLATNPLNLLVHGLLLLLHLRYCTIRIACHCVSLNTINVPCEDSSLHKA
jgi:hypothetical protein